MIPTSAEFVRHIGALRIMVRNLNLALRENKLDSVEELSHSMQELLLEMIRAQRKLPRDAQKSLKPHFAAVRKDALKALELSRKILDDSLEAVHELIKSVQEIVGYGSDTHGNSVLIDRKA